MNEYENEPVPGLPGHLPKGEKLLWQGAPDWRALALSTFHLRALAGYFAVLLAWHVIAGIYDGASTSSVLFGLVWGLGLAALGLAIPSLLAWGMARSTVYSITNKRIVLRYGIALPMAVNLPFKVVESADARVDRTGGGDIALSIAKGQRISWLALWPHARPLQFTQPQPMLRALPNAQAAAAVLARALKQYMAAENQSQAPERSAAAKSKTALVARHDRRKQNRAAKAHMNVPPAAAGLHGGAV